jgi:hypothetical protein
MTQYRIAQGIPSGRYVVQQRSDYWPFWSSAFWQRFERLEDAEELLSTFEKCSQIEYPRNKRRTRFKISNAISKLVKEREFLIVRSRPRWFLTSGKANTLRLAQIEQRLERLYRIYGKLLNRGNRANEGMAA